MLKYFSYLNLFLGIIFIAISKSNGNYLDLASIIPTVFFSWITLFHFIKNSIKFEKWHLFMGFLGVLLSIISSFITVQILLQLYSNKALASGPEVFLVSSKQIFDLLVISQFVIAYKANKKIPNLNSK